MSRDLSKRSLKMTNDGSHTLYVPDIDEHYHSVYGAVNESTHVFIRAGFDEWAKSGRQDLRVMEIGFGTGLNALLTALAARKTGLTVRYFALELYPLAANEYRELDFGVLFREGDAKELFLKLHEADWGRPVEISPFFHLQKIQEDIRSFDYGMNLYDLVYFDAFAPDIQPELWSPDVFGKLYSCMKNGGIMTTYAAKGQVRRDLGSAGFFVERIPGPDGKRHMLRAIKNTPE
jgi:tRNA U34 5-methylaminomethyl-2-thiouridine-forming methyltransferase MnmC